MTRILKWFYTTMLWLTEYELAIATDRSRNFNYICRLKADVWHWRTEQRKFELRSGS